MEQEVNYDAMVEALMEEFWQIKHLKSFGEDSIGRIKRAYLFACDAHKEQRRKSGEPYITHPIAVAKIVAQELMLGPNTIIAAFLHDVVEDTDYTVADIAERFGQDVAFLVETVTKEKKEHYEMSKQLDNYKHMLDSIHYDIRSLLIKLADRLHNMRTLSSMRPDKQMKIAGETDYFYAPLANRLGLYQIKTELENLSMKYRCPADYERIGGEMTKFIEQKGAALEQWTVQLKNHLLKYGIKARVGYKMRSIYSIWRKMQSSGSDFKHIRNIYVVQVNFNHNLNEDKSEKNQCLEIYSALTDLCKEMPGSLRNYIDSPKENGYQAVHFKILDHLGEWNEIHIASERMMYNSRMGCVSERTIQGKDWIGKFKNVLQDMAANGREGTFMDNIVSNFYNDDILVFTPNGNGVVLPKNASALDFAYEIHSKIGDNAQYARVNGKLMAVKTVLKRGDCVEIGTSESVHPKKEWLAYAKTYRARKQILAYLRKKNNESTESKYILCPSCNPLPGDEVIGFTLENGKCVAHKRNCVEAVKQASQMGDNIIAIDFNENATLYPVTINIRAIDRYHLLIDLVSVIAEDLKLSIDNLITVTKDEIVDCTICFAIHSVKELRAVIARIDMVDGVDEVKRINVIKN